MIKPKNYKVTHHFENGETLTDEEFTDWCKNNYLPDVLSGEFVTLFLNFEKRKKAPLPERLKTTQ